MEPNNRYQEAKTVTLIGAAANTLLGIIKIITGYVFLSDALLADGIHSLSDLLTDVLVLFAAKFSNLNADETHHYGHQRIETAATLFLALLLILVGGSIVWHGFTSLLTASHHQPSWYALPVAMLSIAVNESLFHYTRYIGKKIQSNLLLANAWHHRSDAASSAVVLFGLVGVLAGFVFLDALAALIVGLMIIQMGISYTWRSLKELVDTAVDSERLAHISAAIMAISGVKKIHQLRTRLMGTDVYVDVHVLVEPWISVSEGHYIAQHVHHALMMRFDDVKDVTVHIDPEDDEIVEPSTHLPNRDIVEQQLRALLQQMVPHLQKMVLHYLEGRLNIDLFYELPANESPASKAALQTSMQTIYSQYPYIHTITLFACMGTYQNLINGTITRTNGNKA